MHNNLYTMLVITSSLSLVKDNKSCGKGKGKTGKARLKSWSWEYEGEDLE